MRTNRGRTTAGWSTSRPRPRRRSDPPPTARRPNGRAGTRTRSRRAPNTPTRAYGLGRLRTASAPGRPGAAGWRPTPSARRAVPRRPRERAVGSALLRRRGTEATRTSCSVIRNGPAPARRTARSASADFASASADCQQDRLHPYGRWRRSRSVSSATPGATAARASQRRARPSPADALRGCPRPRSGRTPIRGGPTRNGGVPDRSNWSSARKCSERRSRCPGAARGQPERTERRGPCLRDPDEEVEHALEHDPASGQRDGDVVVRPGHPARGEPGHQADRLATWRASVAREAVHARASQRRRPRPPRRRRRPPGAHGARRRAGPRWRCRGRADGTARARGGRRSMRRCPSWPVRWRSPGAGGSRA